MKITILDSASVGNDMVFSPIEALGETEIYDVTASELVSERIKNSDVVVINKVKLNKDNLEGVQSLKLICIFATGYDNVDIEYCKQKGIAVCNVAGYSTDSVAQVTVGAVLDLVNHMREYSDFVNDGSYTKRGIPNRLEPAYHEISGKTWGIIGYGNIGKRVARVAEAFGANVIVNKRTPVDGVRCVDIDTLCKRSDIITVHTPLNDQTRGLINKERIELMKSDVVIFNAARGAVFNESDIADAVIEKRIGGFGTDVYSQEPFSSDHPYVKLLGMPNVLLTPHMAWGSYEARKRVILEVSENIKAFTNGSTRNRIV